MCNMYIHVYCILPIESRTNKRSQLDERIFGKYNQKTIIIINNTLIFENITYILSIYGILQK